MSLSWSRLFPEGRGELNAEGVAFYTDVFAALRSAGVEPLVTLYHWDLPQALDDAYGGWLSRNVVDDFAEYADAAFGLFPNVTRWTTFNEPLTFVGEGYGDGAGAARRRVPVSAPRRQTSRGGAAGS